MQRVIVSPVLFLLAAGCAQRIGPVQPTADARSAAEALSPVDFDYTEIRLPASFGADHVLVGRANASGDLVGQYVSTDSSGKPMARGFVRRNGVFEPLHVEGSLQTSAQGINERGDVVGTFVDARGEHGFLHAAGRFTSFDAAGYTGTRFYDISSTGVIAGSYRSGDQWHPAVWIDGVFTPLPALTAQLGADMAEAFGINSSGQVVGHYTLPGNAADAAGQKMYGFLYHDGAVLATFDYPGSGAMSCGWEVDDDGLVLGHYTDPDSGGVTGYAWKGGRFTARLRVPGATETYPMSFGADGAIAGAALLATGEHVGFTAVPKRRVRVR